jgi:cytochrome P450
VLEAIRADVERLVEKLLDEIDGPGVVDLLARFAYPLPATVIARLLGAPESGGREFERWSADLIAFVGSGRPQAERAARAEASLRAFRAYLEPLIDDARLHPRDDLISALTSADEEGDRLTQDELVSTCVTLLFAGHETTANLIGNGLLALIRHPEELERLRQEPALAPPTVEELLRFDSPVQRLRRRATEDVRIGRTLIRAGELVMAFTGAANRDPERFENPDRLDITRGDTGHLAFGHGVHFCVGAALTRLETQIAVTALLRRFPRLRLAPGPQIRWKPNITFRGLEALPLELR